MQGGLASSAATSSLAGFSPATAQRLFNLADRFTLLVATARPGFSDAVAARETQKALGRRYQVLTHQQFSAQQHALPATSGSGVNGVLGDLVVVALFVALMVIANAFTIVVAQRRRELALLRCLGASRSQVGNLVVVEAVLVGLLGSLAGLGVGVGAAALLRELPLASLAPLRSVPLQVGLPTLILGVVLGVTVAAVGSLVPAIKAAHIPPIIALHQSGHEGPNAPGGQALAGVLGGVGVLGVATGLVFRSPVVFALGTILLLTGLLRFSPALVPVLVRPVGWTLSHVGGVPSQLGERNLIRQARRTGATAAALVIGVGLVSFLFVTQSSAEASVASQLNNTLRADFVVLHTGTGPLSDGPAGSVPLPRRVLTELSRERQLVVSPFELVTFTVDGRIHWGAAVVPRTFPQMVHLGPIEGEWSALGPRTLAVSGPQAKAHGLRLGSVLPATFQSGRGSTSSTYAVAAIYPLGDYYAGYLFSAPVLDATVSGLPLDAVFVKARPGVSVVAERAALGRALAGFPQVVLQDRAQLDQAQQSSISRQIDVVSLLLGLAIVIALLGVVSTLTLSVLERVRELALLRAVGMLPWQLRAMVLTESALIGLLGAVIGVGLGMFLGWSFQRALSASGLSQLVLPWSRLLLTILGGAVVGLAAGYFPARRAGTVDMLKALDEE